MKKYRALFVCAFLFSFSSLFSASSLFHVLIAEKWLQAFECYNEEEKRAFMVGTIFPDIRYIANIPREKTHEYHLTIQEIRETRDPFIKGMRVHAFVDETRENFLQSNPIVEEFRGYPGDAVLFLKILEDEIVFSTYGKNLAASLCSYLQTVEKGALGFSIPLSIIREWNAIQSQFLGCRPRDLFQKLAQSHERFSGFPEKTIIQVAAFLPKYSDKREIKRYVSSLVAEFDQLIFHNVKQL